MGCGDVLFGIICLVVGGVILKFAIPASIQSGDLTGLGWVGIICVILGGGLLFEYLKRGNS